MVLRPPLDRDAAGRSAVYPRWLESSVDDGGPTAVAGSLVRLEAEAWGTTNDSALRWQVDGVDLAGPSWVPRSPGAYAVALYAGDRLVRSRMVRVGVRPGDLVRRPSDIDYYFCLAFWEMDAIHFVPLLGSPCDDGSAGAPSSAGIQREAALGHVAFAQLARAQSRIYGDYVRRYQYIGHHALRAGLYAVFPKTAMYLGASEPVAAAATQAAGLQRALRGQARLCADIWAQAERAIHTLRPNAYTYSEVVQYPSVRDAAAHFSARFITRVINSVVAEALFFGAQVDAPIALGQATLIVAYAPVAQRLVTRVFNTGQRFFRELVTNVAPLGTPAPFGGPGIYADMGSSAGGEPPPTSGGGVGAAGTTASGVGSNTGIGAGTSSGDTTQQDYQDYVSALQSAAGNPGLTWVDLGSQWVGVDGEGRTGADGLEYGDVYLDENGVVIAVWDEGANAYDSSYLEVTIVQEPSLDTSDGGQSNPDMSQPSTSDMSDPTAPPTDTSGGAQTPNPDNPDAGNEGGASVRLRGLGIRQVPVRSGGGAPPSGSVVTSGGGYTDGSPEGDGSPGTTSGGTSVQGPSGSAGGGGISGIRLVPGGGFTDPPTDRLQSGFAYWAGRQVTNRVAVGGFSASTLRTTSGTLNGVRITSYAGLDSFGVRVDGVFALRFTSPSAIVVFPSGQTIRGTT